jgi:hypothetical protein
MQERDAPAAVPAPVTDRSDAATNRVSAPDPDLSPARLRPPVPPREPGESADWVLASLVVVATVFLLTR